MSEAHYVRVCAADEIPDGHREVFSINERWVAIFNLGDRYYAIEDLCTHDGNILTEDRDGNPVPLEEDAVISCPRHGARFDVRTGEALSGPAGTTELPFYGVRVQDGFIEVTSRPIRK